MPREERQSVSEQREPNQQFLSLCCCWRDECLSHSITHAHTCTRTRTRTRTNWIYLLSCTDDFVCVEQLPAGRDQSQGSEMFSFGGRWSGEQEGRG